MKKKILIATPIKHVWPKNKGSNIVICSEAAVLNSTPQTYDKTLLDKKSWVKNHPFWAPQRGPSVRNPDVSAKKLLTQGPILRFLIIRPGCTAIQPSSFQDLAFEID